MGTKRWSASVRPPMHPSVRSFVRWGFRAFWGERMEGMGDAPKCGMLMYPDHLQNDSILVSIDPILALWWPKNLRFPGILRGTHGKNVPKCGIRMYWILSSFSLVLGQSAGTVSSLIPCYIMIKCISHETKFTTSLSKLRWRHNGRIGVSNHQPNDRLLKRLFRSKKISKLRVTGLCVGNSPTTGEFPAQMASNAENVSIWWRHHDNVIRNSSALVLCNTCGHRDKDYISETEPNVPCTIVYLASWGRPPSQIVRFTWPTCGPPGSCRPQVGLTWAPWTLLSGFSHSGTTHHTQSYFSDWRVTKRKQIK